MFSFHVANTIVSIPAIRTSFPPHFIRIVVEVSLGTSTCPTTVVAGKQVHAPCRIHKIQQNLFFMSLEFHGDHEAVTELRRIWPPSVLVILPDLI